jgi:hypothetical protein
MVRGVANPEGLEQMLLSPSAVSRSPASSFAVAPTAGLFYRNAYNSSLSFGAPS